MDRLTIKTKDLTPSFEVDGLSLTSQFPNIEKFYGIPAALHNVDSKFRTTTYLDVVKAATSELHFLVEGKEVQLLDPKSTYLTDEKFDQAVEVMTSALKIEPIISKRGFQSEAKVVIPATDKDNFLKDAFKRMWHFIRKPEGGVALSTSIERLACTNGMTIPDSEYNQVSRKKMFDVDAFTKMHATAALLNIDDYLKEKFTQNGEPIPCSVADMMDMASTLTKITDDEDYTNEIFPIQGVQDFYAAQAIDTTKLARKWLDKLPTGLSYYQALQILTNGAKRMLEPTLENQLKVSKFCAPKRIQNMKDTGVYWEGTPKWSNNDISHWMGDVA